jgi:hypothetical protein
VRNAAASGLQRSLGISYIRWDNQKLRSLTDYIRRRSTHPHRTSEDSASKCASLAMQVPVDRCIIVGGGPPEVSFGITDSVRSIAMVNSVG